MESGAAALAFGLWLFITVLLITAVGTVVVVGAWLLPETVPLLRRIAGAKRAMTAGRTGQRIPEAYRPRTGTLRERVRSAARTTGPATLATSPGGRRLGRACQPCVGRGAYGRWARTPA
ncbi:hypothetical protein ACFV29_33150 [Streptomyces sp. NPDC059690]|uniref:hypothetical protein n=1 Tax=Streptomyces sp. NPDC059690 TaxID=3346907 RepID=UPI00368E7D30